MAITVHELVQSLEKITLTGACNAAKGALKISNALYDSTKPLKVKLAEGLDLTCPWEPGVYKGTGLEDRLGIVFRATEEIYDAFAALEHHCREILEADDVKNVSQLWSSCLRSDKFGKSIRAKINVKGNRCADFWDADNSPSAAPTEYRNLPINAICQVRGVYIQKTTIGLLIDVVSLQYGNALGDADKQSPF